VGVDARDGGAGQIAHAVHASLLGGWGRAEQASQMVPGASATPTTSSTGPRSMPAERCGANAPRAASECGAAPRAAARTWKLLMPLSMRPATILSASSSLTPRSCGGRGAGTRVSYMDIPAHGKPAGTQGARSRQHAGRH
jgi:hypothetical protein